MDHSRLVDVSWNRSSKQSTYPIELVIESIDSPGQLNQVVSTLLELRIELVSVKSFVGKQDALSIMVQIRCESMSQFEYVKSKLLQLPDIFAVYRPRV